MNRASTRTRAALQLGAVLAAPALLLAACGSGTSATTAGSSASGSPTAGKSVTVETRSGPLGTYLTDGSGRTVYLFASDTAGKSTCSGPCVSAWPPLTAKGSPTGAGGAHPTMLATFVRSDGATQVTYDGHPLYYFAGDSAAGDTKGQGIDGFGAKWWVVAPSGTSITKTAGAATGSSGGTGW